MNKEKIFIINYFDIEEMRWYDKAEYRSREKYFSTLTGEEFDSLAEATKSKKKFLKEAKEGTAQGNEQSGKFKEIQEYQENLAKLEDVNLEEEAQLQEEMMQESI